jgi:hypothetical protein
MTEAPQQWTPETTYRDPTGKVFPPTVEINPLDNPEAFTEVFMEHFRAHMSQLHAAKQPAWLGGYWDKVPSRWKDCLLETLAPSDRSYSSIAEQTERIAILKLNPTGNYIFEGAGACGKTHLLHTLYRHRLEEWARHPLAGDGCTVHMLNVNEWLNSVTAHATDHSHPAHKVTVANIRKWAGKGLPVAIFLNEADKFSYTPAKAANLFELTDAIYDNEGQVCMTSNLSVAELIARWPGDVAAHLLRRVGAKPYGRTLTFTRNNEGSAA